MVKSNRKRLNAIMGKRRSFLLKKIVRFVVESKNQKCYLIAEK